MIDKRIKCNNYMAKGVLNVEETLLVLALSLDAFVASLAYGANKIKMPFTSIIIINLVCAAFLTLSIFFGTLVKKIFPQNIATIISFTILILLGVYYLFESIVKSYLQKKLDLDKKVKFKLFNIWFVVEIYIDEIKADLDNSKKLSSKEALYLASALSLDSLAIGFGSSLGNINYIHVILLSLFFDIIAIWSGLFIGKNLAEKSKINLSWLAGIILIILAFLKLI